MVLFLLFVIVECLKKSGNNGSYMSYNCSLSVKGAFVVLVFLRHFKTYPMLIPEYESLFLMLDDHLSQLIVTMFLFYSGYGIFESIKKRGEYVKSIPRRKLFKVLFQFDVTVMLYLILGFICGESFSLQKIFLSFVAWDNLNNSNWYIFAIFWCYIFSYVSFRFFFQDHMLCLVFSYLPLHTCFVLVSLNRRIGMIQSGVFLGECFFLNIGNLLRKFYPIKKII